MGRTNPDRAISPPDPMLALTLAEMKAREWELVARCSRTHCVTLSVSLDALITLHGPDAFWWGRRPKCRVVDCTGRVVFLARAHKFGSWRTLRRLSAVEIERYQSRYARSEDDGMCNEHQNRVPESAYFDTFRQLNIPLKWADDARSNLEPKDRIRIKDQGPVIRWAADHAELSVLPWSWNAPNGRPVFNFRADGRSFAGSDRCLIPSDGFFEFTTPEDPKQKKKDRWRFTLAGEPWFFIAGIVRENAWTMLTTEPGPDIAPFHDRQIVLLRRDQAGEWLNLTRPETALFAPPPAGTLSFEKVSDPA